MTDQLKQLNHDVFLLEIKLKEKDQELKLTELKYKELKKQMPHNKLRPIRPSESRQQTSLQPQMR